VCTGLDFGQGQGDMERLRDVYERADVLDHRYGRNNTERHNA